MTSSEAILKLQLLVDKTGSPYFTTDEYLSFLNMAQNEVLNKMIPDTIGGTANFELDQNVSENIKFLIWTISTTPNAAGRVDYSTIETSLRQLSSDNTATFFKIMAVTYLNNGIYTPVKFIKHNNVGAYRANVFKSSVQGFTYLQYAIQFHPSITSPVRITIMKAPVIMTAINSPDWNDYVMNQVIQVAYQMATVATRDESGLQLGTNTTIQSK